MNVVCWLLGRLHILVVEMLGSGRTKVVAVADPEEDTMAEDFNLSTQSIRRYPMMVMSLHKVLSLTRLEQHQVYKERGDLVEYKDGMQVIFASHEWVSRAHPDPDMVSSAELIRHTTQPILIHTPAPLSCTLSRKPNKRVNLRFCSMCLARLGSSQGIRQS